MPIIHITRPFILTLAAVILLGSLAGCGGGSDDDYQAQIKALEREKAEAQARVSVWKVIGIVALVAGGVVGIALGTKALRDAQRPHG